MPFLPLSSMTMAKLKRLLASFSHQRWHGVVIYVLRVLIGGLFIFSGFVKAIDPWGSFYKFTEYVSGLHLGFGAGQVLFLAFAVAIVEFVLGVCILVGCYRRGAPIVALTFIGAMLPLTFYLAVTDAVPDCGCFGDAWVLGNWATFIKNVIIAALLYYLLLYNRRYPPLYGPAVHWVVGALSFAFALSVSLYGYFVQPLIDFRPYGVGENLVSVSSTSPPEDDNYTFVYEKDGQQATFTIDSLPDEEDGWVFVERKEKGGMITPTQRQDKQGFTIFDEGVDVTDDVLSPEGEAILVLFPDMRHVDISSAYPVNRMAETAGNLGVSLVALTGDAPDVIAWWNDISMASYPIYTCDDSDIKMLARGNPAVVFLHNGTIAWKRTLSSLDVERIAETHDLETWGRDFDATTTLHRLLVYYLLAMIALLILNRAYPLLRLLFTKKRVTDEKTETTETTVTETANQSTDNH